MTKNSNADSSQQARRPQSARRPAPGTVIKGRYPTDFRGGTPQSVFLYINLGDKEDYLWVKKVMPAVNSRPVNEVARKAIEAERAAEMAAMAGKEVERPGLVDTGFRPLREAYPDGVARYDMRDFLERMSASGFRLTEAYFQEGGKGLNDKPRPPRLCVVFDGPTSPFSRLPTCSDEIIVQVKKLLENSAFSAGVVWDNTMAKANSLVFNCRPAVSESERYVRIAPNWGIEVVEL